MKKQLLNILLFLIGCLTTYAHTVWIETETNGKLNKPHQVKVFFGEPDIPTFTEKWFSDIKDLELLLIYPSGKKEILSKTQKESHYLASFIPSEKGIYTLSVKHLVKDVFKEMKITYQSVAFVSVGTKEVSELTLGELPLQLSFDTSAVKTNGTKIFKMLKEGNVAGKERVSITSENGWAMAYRTDSNGRIKFNPLWKGNYLLEFSWSNKEEGNHNGKSYKMNYQTINYLIKVK
ncbi:DUF4198 domain-containing protein [Capnocytophaga cynodegmi]|uniref:DUF4198 domain-containing protein n=1 Tax=Capnocytophaga cynodegmi TaxID=28189 RepID=A0A0B7H769_9FLAO|nr:DUF4198 domain-containing protein [Capnocytophaga cynodegmi]CEN34389.1 conserved exported hypothetical protein [Capnocytophaga cynodegmi]